MNSQDQIEMGPHQRPTRLWYFSDPHGSELCYAKILAVAAEAVEHNLFDAIIVGGDLCGRDLVPIMQTSNGWSAQYSDRHVHISEQELPRFTEDLALTGQYLYRCRDEGELRQLQGEAYRQSILDELAEARFRDWLARIDAMLPPGHADRCKIILNTGTSDSPKIDEILSNHQSVIFAENAVHKLPGNVWIASTSYREWLDDSEPSLEVARRRKISPGAMRERIRRLIEPVPDLDRCIFNFHVPPHDTLVDQFGHQPLLVPERHTGSEIIRKAIEFHQPLASLHGYAHDSRARATIGRTHSINPGTEYYRGLLPGVILEIDTKGQLSYGFTEDPLFHSSDAFDNEFSWRAVKIVFKNTFPVVGPLIKIYEELRKLRADIEKK